MTRKIKTHSAVAIVSVIAGSDAEISALDRISFDVLKLNGRGRRMTDEQITAFGDLVLIMQQIKVSGGTIPRKYLSRTHLKNPALVRVLFDLRIPHSAGMDDARLAVLRNGGDVTPAEREKISRAAAHYMTKASGYA